MSNSKHEPAMISSVFSLYVKSQIRNLILKKGLRVDGRKLDEFRPINIEVDVFKKLHGSCLFQRGQTQVFSTVTFDSVEAAFHPDSISQMLGSQQKKTFMLHYEFPGYATNEISASRGANRREIGHGALAEKALKHVIPDEFPYSIRRACQVLESNGSSSMASACGGSVALLDAGVRLKNPVGGVAIGLMTNPEKPDEDYRLLTDLMGMEDYAGDMDFKIAGTEKGFTAMQLDVKTLGLTRKQLKESLEVGDRGVKFVLGKMRAAISGPRVQFKPTVPVVEVVSIEHFKRLILFRNGAYNLKLIEAETGVKISQEDDTHVSLFAPNPEKLQQAKDLMQKLFDENEVKEYPYGKMLHVEIIEMSDRGVMVKLPDGGAPIFIPNVRLSNVPIKHPSAAGLQVGQKITIQWLGRDPTTGQIRVSRRTTAGLSSQAANS
ncbi:hypothetical protein WR25_12532 [Diploscapter pachys]|uniref:polyribonucleotide nucleotidyltransferase n=1 Tax=Diploscapter pachys TaxID=2018661 RepID=A0A2A2JV20_9BILA|nr:hypothetical protein WR25_12532 [Diploscapter pachys]